MHVAEKVNKAYSMLWLIKRNFKDIGAEAFVTLYKHLIRSHLEYNNSVWSPHKKSDIEKLERVQKRATKMIPGMPTSQPLLLSLISMHSALQVLPQLL